MEEKAELPQNWVWTTIAKIGIITSGGTPQSTELDNFGNEVAWVTPADLSGYTEKYISLGARSLSKKGLNSCSAKVIPSGSVLFSSRAPVGYVAIAANDISTNQGFKNLTPDSGLVDTEYVYYYLKASKRLAESYASGTTFLELSGKNFGILPFPLPPLPEQRRIVAKLEELFSRLDAGVAAVRRTQALLKRYRQSVLHAAVTGELTRAWREAHPTPPETGEALLTRIRAERRAQWEAAQVAKRGGQLPLNDAWKKKYEEPAAPDTSELPELPELPAGWVWATSEQLCSSVASGSTPKPEELFSDKGEIPFLKVYNLTKTGHLDFTNKPTFIREQIHVGQMNRSRAHPGDVLINIVGPPLGKVSMVTDEYPEWNINRLALN